jgi:hypothetical protein
MTGLVVMLTPNGHAAAGGLQRKPKSNNIFRDADIALVPNAGRFFHAVACRGRTEKAF